MTASQHPPRATGDPRAPLPAVILAGGRSARMGGINKATLALSGRSLLAHVHDRLGAQADPVAVNAAQGTAPAGMTVLPDRLPDGVPDRPGPLAGILTAMDWAATLGASAVVTAAVDTPFLPRDLVARLRAATDGAAPAIAAAPGADGIRLHPTAALWPVALRDRLRADLQAGQRRLAGWASAQGARPVVFDKTPDPFFNINTPQDLAEAERRFGRTG